MRIRTSNIPSPDLKNLFWNIFFESKNRGVSLTRHFPWLESGSGDTFFFEADAFSQVIGGLVLRQIERWSGGKEINIGMVGLVCVAPENRGAGVAGQLLESAISHAKDLGLDYLTLWTSQHRFYSRHRFRVADNWLYGWVETDSRNTNETFEISSSDFLFLENNKPLPPFATAIYEHSSHNCSFTVVVDKAGAIVANYEGDAIDVGTLLVQALPKRWRLNAVKSDPLIQTLLKLDVKMDLSPTNLQMWLNLEKPEEFDSNVNDITIPFLDRI